MNRIINGANRDCRKYVKDLRAAIEAATDAVAGIDDMIAEMPNNDCEAAAIAHRETIAAQADQLLDMVDSFKSTCDTLTDCLSNGGITVQDGGGKNPRIFDEFYMLAEHSAVGGKYVIC